MAALAVASGAASAGAGSTRAAADYVSALIGEARRLRLSGHRTWQVLLHYRPVPGGGWQSEADGPAFFLAGPAGRTRPEAEIEATLRAFAEPPRAEDPDDPATQHAQCRFPARWAWLREALRVDPARLPAQRCPMFETWRTAFSAEAVTLVYATAYLNSPASMYGHTFLRLSRATGEGNPLLDYIINFAADVTTDNGLVYAALGVTGGFRGHFYTMPYYVKVQEYANMESRDLWEYELSLSREQAERMVMHAWETRSTWFDYFFFTENCSYFLLTLLEAADPSLRLTDVFGPRVIPADTVRAVVERSGVVRRVTARPSLASTMTKRKALLSRVEVTAAEALARGGRSAAADHPLAALPPPRQALVVDAAMDYLRYREGFAAAPSKEFARRERELLVARGRTSMPPVPVPATAAIEAPDRGHRTLRFGLGWGVTGRRDAFETISLRGAIHDYLDRPAGYPEDALLEMASIRLRYRNQARRLDLERFDAVHIVSAAPLDRWTRKLSWKVRIGAETAPELGCDREGWRCLVAGAAAGTGVAVRVGPGKGALVYGFVESEVGAGPALGGPAHLRVGPGASLGVVAALTSFWRLELETRAVEYLVGDRRRKLGARVAEALSLGQSAALRLGFSVAGTHAEAAAELHAYF